MAGRKSAKNEIQDPSLPSKKRARWRLIGAAVLACAAVILLPFALESEPRRELGDVAVKMPARTDLGKMDRVLPTGNTAPGLAPGNASLPTVSNSVQTRVAADSTSKPKLPAERVKPVVIDSQGANVNGARSAALPPVKPLVAGAGSSPPANPKVAKPKQVAARPVAGVGSETPKSAKPKSSKPKSEKPKVQVSKKVDLVAAVSQQAVKAPPIPKRRTDPNSLKAASPSGYVVQIGAFSNRKSARAQVTRGKKLGFDPYTEKITTAKGPRIRVRIGPYLTRKQANAARSKLKGAGIETALIAP